MITSRDPRRSSQRFGGCFRCGLRPFRTSCTVEFQPSALEATLSMDRFAINAHGGASKRVDLSPAFPPAIMFRLFFYFEGPIPESLSLLQHLEELWLNRNRLSGVIPAGLGRLPRLRELYLNANDLVGGIPSSFGELGSLEGLDLSWNQLSGDIAPCLGNMVRFACLASTFKNSVFTPSLSWCQEICRTNHAAVTSACGLPLLCGFLLNGSQRYWPQGSRPIDTQLALSFSTRTRNRCSAMSPIPVFEHVGFCSRIPWSRVKLLFSSP